MKPYSEELQLKRAKALSRLVLDPDISPEMREVYQRHLHGLARNETEYNTRVANIYGKPPQKVVVRV